LTVPAGVAEDARMLAADPTFPVQLAAAAGVGVLHTLLGPDHYLPLLAIAKASGWSAHRTMLVTACAGLLHCGASALLLPFALAATRAAGTLAGVQDLRATVAAWLVVGLGLAAGVVVGWCCRGLFLLLLFGAEFEVCWFVGGVV